jgi:hypothetical protein
MWYVGLAWADTHHDVEVLDEAGKRVGVRRFAHSHEGLHELKAFLLDIVASPEELAYYQRKRAEGKTHSMAVRALANI